MDEISNLLGCILGVVGLVQKFPILSGLARGDFIHVYPFVAELSQELRHEHNSCNVPSRNQVDFTPMSQLPKPKVVCLRSQKLFACWYNRAATGSFRGSHPSMSSFCEKAD